jgi:hypothetical protein
MADNRGDIPLSAEDIDEVARFIFHHFGGDVEDYRSRANNMQPSLRVLFHIGSERAMVETLPETLAADAADAADSEDRKGRATIALQLLLWRRYTTWT